MIKKIYTPKDKTIKRIPELSRFVAICYGQAKFYKQLIRVISERGHKEDYEQEIRTIAWECYNNGYNPDDCNDLRSIRNACQRCIYAFLRNLGYSRQRRQKGYDRIVGNFSDYKREININVFIF